MASFSLLSHASPFSSFFVQSQKHSRCYSAGVGPEPMCIKSKSVVAAVNKKGQSEHKTHKEER